jgi:methionyl-tRNA synthetase
MLLALSLPLQKTLLAHAHWTIEQKKMSKSIGNVADPFDAMNTFGVDVVRYYLARVGGRFRDDVGASLSLVSTLWGPSDECGAW